MLLHLGFLILEVGPSQSDIASGNFSTAYVEDRSRVMSGALSCAAAIAFRSITGGGLSRMALAPPSLDKVSTGTLSTPLTYRRSVVNCAIKFS